MNEKIVDLATGQETLREYTKDEIATVEAELAQQAKNNADQADKDAAKQAFLDKLGLSADEVAALLG